MKNYPFTLLIHIALAIIVAGAVVTHFCGIQGTVTLQEGVSSCQYRHVSGPGNGVFPFNIRLDSIQVVYYPGTTNPMDFKSMLSIDGKHITVSMNKIAVIDGWRLYQSAMGPQYTTLSVSHDPWGVAITYTGYILLGIGMIGFFFQKKTVWRGLLKKLTPILFLLFLPMSSYAADTELPTMQKPLARNFGKIYVYWNDRICPLQTMAIDISTKLYGKRTYKGMTPEQILAGWLFYYDSWMHDFNESHAYPSTEKGKKKYDEQLALINWIGNGQAFRIYPYKSASGHMEWLSLTERKPSQMPLEQWIFMNKSMTGINDLLQEGRNRAANDALSELIEGQRKYAGENILPSDRKFKAEIFYNDYIRLVPLSVFFLIIGIIGIFLEFRHIDSHNCKKIISCVIIISSVTATTWLALILSLRGWIGGHWPLSNGCETMLFMAFVSAAGSMFLRNDLFRGSLMVVASISTLVASMASKTPQIASLTPVLDSPLLTIHVMILMCSYSLFLLMAVFAAIALIKNGETGKHLATVNAVLLIPAEFLLTAGIFIGAVWANQSWGRYWGWDPKETCALITMIIYAIPMHRCIYKSKKKDSGKYMVYNIFANPNILNIYLLCAILSVIFTYFGANYIFPGLHSYA